MSTIEKADLFECRYFACEDALIQEKLRTLEQEEQKIKAAAILIQERRAVLLVAAQQIKPKLDELVAKLEQQYGVDQHQINWETGEIHALPEAASEAPQITRTGQHQGLDASAGERERLGPDAAGEARTKTSDSGGAKDPGPAVE